VEAVKRGYDQIAAAYLAERNRPSTDLAQLDEFERLVPPGSQVLDLGCGAGRPVLARLARQYRVTGLDFSESQLALARQLVPEAELVQADMVRADLGEAQWHGIVSFYALIHVPREHHRRLLQKVLQALAPRGIALLCLGANDLEADWDDYHGATMFWSHFDTDTYLRMIDEVGFERLRYEEVVDDSYPEGRHLFVLLSKGSP